MRIELTESDKKRFFGHVLIGADNECWEWVGQIDRYYGYAKFTVDEVLVSAHRVSYLIHNGELPPSFLHICHHCDNPSCVNPHHLFAATHKTNHWDSMRKGRKCRSNKWAVFDRLLNKSPQKSEVLPQAQIQPTKKLIRRRILTKRA